MQYKYLQSLLVAIKKYINLNIFTNSNRFKPYIYELIKVRVMLFTWLKKNQLAWRANMLYQLWMYLGLSIIFIIFAKYIHLLLIYLNMFYTYIHIKLNSVFVYFGMNLMLRKIVLLVAIPLIITGIPAIVYKVITGKNMPYFAKFTWGLWLILALSYILIRH